MNFGRCFYEVTEQDCYQLKRLKFIPDYFVDIGVNYGSASWFARQLWPNVKIIGFEPNPETFAIAAKNLSESNVDLRQKGLGDGKPVRVGIKIPGDSPCDFTVPEELGGIATFMLDELGPMPNSILKVDCEGAEFYLREQRNLEWIRENVSYLCAEWHCDIGVLSKHFPDFNEYKRVLNDVVGPLFEYKHVQNYNGHSALLNVYMAKRLDMVQ